MDHESREMFEKIIGSLEKIDSRFEEMDRKFEKIDRRFEAMDHRFEKIENRLEVIELKQDRTAKKLDDLQLDVKIAEKGIRQDIHKLQDEMETVIEVLKQNEMIPQ